ncbi:MAG: homoserine kinase [bacterium]
MKQEIKIFAPATVANVGCGFDVFGFALNRPGDEVHIRLVDTPGVVISKIVGDGGMLSIESDKNTASVAVKALLNHLKIRHGAEIDIYKKMPIQGGLGSSAASSCAALLGVNILLGNPLEKTELLKFSIEGERVACGYPHADNAAPALLGGFVLVRSYDPLEVVRIPVPGELYCAILYPNAEVETRVARDVLKKHVLVSDAVAQWGNTAGLIAGLMKGDFELVGRSLEDRFAEPERAKFIPGFFAMKEAARQAGALGSGIAGSGPSLFALTTTYKNAEGIAAAMNNAFITETSKTGVVYISKISQKGTRVVE